MSEGQGAATTNGVTDQRGSNGATESPGRGDDAAKPVILVDASNVAYGRTSGSGKPQMEFLRRMLTHLAEEPVRVVTIADATLRHEIDRPTELEAMMGQGTVEQVPAGTSADDFLWELWKRSIGRGQTAYILTNDFFPNRRNAEEAVVTWSPRIAYFFIADELILKPSIQSILGTDSHGQSGANREDARESVAKGPAAAASEPSTTISRNGTLTDRPANWAKSASDSGSKQAADKSSCTKPVDGELIDAAVRTIARHTGPPGGKDRIVNFAGIASDLHVIFEGNFVTRFGLSRPRDLVTELADRDLVSISFKGTTMYVEPTDRLERLIADRGLPRRERTTSSKATGREPPYPLVLPPSIVVVSAGAPSPTVEIASPDVFLKLAQDHHTMHIFYWPCGVYRDQYDNRFRSAGEFFFASEGTSYRLMGRGYRNLSDFLDARTHGFAGADDQLRSRAKRYTDSWGHEGYRMPDAWFEVIGFSKLEQDELPPLEGDVYYCARASGFTELSDFIEDRARKEKERPQYV